ncbi:hypothetical protein K388_07157 [Streptomyces sp. KhCrAH-43]|uniref:hypothetical protein n=1 Tax=unclassified Streptomyces TaxID=2593676 RepID=UPI000371C603|nr:MULTISPECIES: hypothetical protein [unclassified Streptomyces]MYS33465.1 hypothetical protein [Streptomyces sp. SID4920]MYX63708.1 hypothetical protein [Streptomyces sp. SID8373]RAJ47812.1 hypothetical protein K388_07157 [Streptomyces sp. KhCrAH-43]
MTTATAQPPRTRITNEKHAPDNRAMKKIWMLENLIFHARTGEEERAAAERMLDRAIATAQEKGQLTPKQDGGDGTWHGYRLPDIRYGARYEEVKRLSTTEIARRIRADIKLARKVEEKLGTATGAEVALTDSLTALATMPKQIKVSVRTDYFSGGSAIRVNVYNLPKKGWGYVQETDMWGQPRWVPGPELSAILAALEEIHGAYNFDGSDAMVDYFHVNYYGQVEVDWRERP